MALRQSQYRGRYYIADLEVNKSVNSTRGRNCTRGGGGAGERHGK